MNDIKWEDRAVCFAGGFNYRDFEFNANKGYKAYAYLIGVDDFQLNEIQQGDFILTEELDTEQKYNDAVAVFELFGFVPSVVVKNYKSAKTRNLTCLAGELWRGRVAEMQKRKITYPQLLSIGKLKRAMIERDNRLVCGKPKEEFVNAINKVNTLEGVLCTPQTTSDCKELDLNLVITGEGSYILDCINGVEYHVNSRDDYNKVINAIRLLQEREK